MSKVKLFLIFIYIYYLSLRKTGSVGFSRRIGYIRNYDGGSMVARALCYRDEFGHVFTDAYANKNYNMECKLHGAEKLYENVFRRYLLIFGCCIFCGIYFLIFKFRDLQGLWDRRFAVANVALNTKSYKETINILRKIYGFGGTGFYAKEILLDVFRCMEVIGVDGFFDDMDSWSPLGPGARRGLGRILDL